MSPQSEKYVPPRRQTRWACKRPQDSSSTSSRPRLNRSVADRTLLVRCRELLQRGLEERETAWRKCGVSVTFASNRPNCPVSRRCVPEYRESTLRSCRMWCMRLDRAFQAFFRRVRAGRDARLSPLPGRDRYNSFTYPQVGDHGGARWTNGFLVLSKIGRIAVRWIAPTGGHAQDRHDLRGGGWLVRLYLLRGCASATVAAHWTGDGHRPGD